MKQLDAEQQAALDRIRKMPWSAQFYKTIENPSAHGGKVDMYMLIDDDTGESIVGLSVPHGDGWIAEYVAGCCADPYFVRTREAGDTTIAVALNRALAPFVDKDNQLDGREVYLAGMTLMLTYGADIAKRARAELIDRTISLLTNLRNQE